MDARKNQAAIAVSSRHTIWRCSNLNTATATEVIMRIPFKRQFSLRSLLAASTVTCLALGGWAEHAHQQRRAVRAILEAGGSVTYDYVPGDGNKLKRVLVNRTAQHTFGFDFFHTPTDVEASSPSPVNGKKIVAQLRYLPAVSYVTLCDVHITDEILEELTLWRDQE